MNQLQTKQESEAQIRRSLNTLNEFSRELESRMTALGHARTMKYAQMTLQPSPLCKNEQSEVIALLIQYTQVLFGLNVDKLPTVLWEAAYDAICERFFGITIVDIQNAFRYSQIEKKQYTTLTRDELLEPISKYWTGKLVLLREIEAVQKKAKEEEESIKIDRENFEKAKALYISCLDTGVWTGNEFEAKSIVKNFEEFFFKDLDKETREELKKQAREQRYQKLEEAKKLDKEFGDFIPVPSEKHIFAQIYISYLVKRRIKFIVL